MSYGLFSSGEAPLGSYAQFASFRSLIQEADGKNYLRLGSVVPASFADAKLMAKSDYVFLPQVDTNDEAGLDHCDSGAIILFTLGGAGNYRRSTDDLLTSTNETWPATYIPATPIRWTGTKFVVAAYVSGGGLYILSSTTGLTGSWTVATVTASVLPTPTEVHLEFSPLTPATMVCVYTTLSAVALVYSSINGGANWTSRLSSSFDQYRKPFCIGMGAAGRWVVPYGGIDQQLLNQAYTMPADFSSAPVNNALARQMLPIADSFSDGTNVVAIDRETGADWYSTDGLNWNEYRSVSLTPGPCTLNRSAGAFWKFVNTNDSALSLKSQQVLRSTDGKTWFQKNTGLNNAIGSNGLMKRGFVTQSLKVVGAGTRQTQQNKHALAGWAQATHIGTLAPAGYTDNYTGSGNGSRFPAIYMRIK